MEASFPDLAEVPPRPKPDSTADERAALRTQLERRRDEINHAAASLLRGGTEPVPVALDSQVPAAPSSGALPPPPLPKGLPPSPERPQSVAGDGAAAEPENVVPKNKKADMIEAPGEAQMPPPRAAAEKDDEDAEAADGQDSEEDSDDGEPDGNGGG